MTTSLVPPIGAAGTWVLKAPYATEIVSGLTYTCVAVRRLGEFRLLGIDPYTQYYEPKEVPAATYASDLNQGDVCIVSLQTAAGKLIFVPSTYIESYPNPNGYRYTPVILAVDIGSIPDALNLSAVKTDIMEIVKTYLGIDNVSVTSIAVGESKAVNQNDHNSLEAARQGRITASKTLFTQVQELNAKNAALAARNTQLENYILANPPTPTP